MCKDGTKRCELTYEEIENSEKNTVKEYLKREGLKSSITTFFSFAFICR
jgi:hypothetical protein